jgi:hypothetical protein
MALDKDMIWSGSSGLPHWYSSTDKGLVIVYLAICRDINAFSEYNGSCMDCNAGPSSCKGRPSICRI